MNELQLLGLIMAASVLTVGAFVLVGLRMRRIQRRADAELDRNERIRDFEADARQFTQSDDKRVRTCGEFIAKTAERARSAAACHVGHRADQLLSLVHVARFHAVSLEHFPQIDTPHGKFTTRLLTGMELICSGKHLLGMEELTPLVMDECVPMVIRRTAFRAGLISGEMRGIIA